MAHVEKSIEVEAPVDEVYKTWMDYEDYPRFMDGVREVRRLSPYRTRWIADYGGTREEWDSRITDTTTNRRIAWTSESGERNDGEVILEPLDRDRTRIYFAMDYQPEGVMASSAQHLGKVEQRVDGDLKRFKRYVEGEQDMREGFSTGYFGQDTDRFRGETRDRGTNMFRQPRLNALEWASAAVTALGAIDVGLVGIFDFNPIASMFGRRSLATRITYGVIGASAVYTLFGLARADMMSRRQKSSMRRMGGDRMEHERRDSGEYARTTMRRGDPTAFREHDPSEFDEVRHAERRPFA
jgi:uncharacterized membrane protein YuzA (DUF378 family)/ribosome-associated toxin RatA of RatAB toxin-antitoxin module